MPPRPMYLTPPRSPAQSFGGSIANAIGIAIVAISLLSWAVQISQTPGKSALADGVQWYDVTAAPVHLIKYLLWIAISIPPFRFLFVDGMGIPSII